MLSNVEVRTPRGLLLSLPLFDASDGYEVRDISGLDPVTAIMVSSSFTNMEGEDFQSVRRDKRNIIFDLGLRPDYSTKSTSDLRNDLYNFFMPKSQVDLRFFSDDGVPTVDISGRVETMDSPRFVKNPYAKISVICFNPDFYVPTLVVFEGDTVSDTTEAEITYVGTVNTGFIFKLFVDRTIGEFTIYQRLADNTTMTMEIDMPDDMVDGDVLEISTIPGSKGAWLTHLGVESSVLYAISPTSAWPVLDPGVNNIRVSAVGAAIPYSIEYTVKLGAL